jgi:hypothetical protein
MMHNAPLTIIENYDICNVSIHFSMRIDYFYCIFNRNVGGLEECMQILQREQRSGNRLFAGKFRIEEGSVRRLP